MKIFRIVGVPEHFNLPFRILAKEQPFEKEGIHIDWIEESRGSGQMSQMLKSSEAEMAILLTESFFKEFDQGNTCKLVGYHVKSPLIWGIHTRPDFPFDDLKSINHPKFLVSRMGSGSHLMALVLAEKMNWSPKNLHFEVVGNLDGARDAFQQGSNGLFLWEKYTTSPEVKNGNMNRLDEIPSPWPCFVMVTSEKALDEFPEIARRVRDQIYSIIQKLRTQANLAEIISEAYKLAPDDVKQWLLQTTWCENNQISRSELEKIFGDLMHFGIISHKPDISDFALVDWLEILD
ncbi:ABC transporter substrate-binding protein [Algoriphagus kandeliae]|uniref:ABC transporter substrate-binding protein n=1 Tax=Algoriphagus kandeliae TaxID=2562278 RepID=A0A4Y9QZX9_9BACT|nr:ABC transporter substrate-binding protein [Algoriphagus kandeliae]TFV97328.1 ABC transporter substrate-binding protein [Algoriphagus kandeliae]